jgi:Fe-S-cluster-containing dehydrogenase component
MACPFGIPEIEATKGFMTKCDLCMERAKEELPPACVVVCPAGAIVYGEYDKVIDKSKSRAVELLMKKKIIVKELRARS